CTQDPAGAVGPGKLRIRGSRLRRSVGWLLSVPPTVGTPPPDDSRASDARAIHGLTLPRTASPIDGTGRPRPPVVRARTTYRHRSDTSRATVLPPAPGRLRRCDAASAFTRPGGNRRAAGRTGVRRSHRCVPIAGPNGRSGHPF